MEVNGGLGVGSFNRVLQGGFQIFYLCRVFFFFRKLRESSIFDLKFINGEKGSCALIFRFFGVPKFEITLKKAVSSISLLRLRSLGKK